MLRDYHFFRTYVLKPYIHLNNGKFPTPSCDSVKILFPTTVNILSFESSERTIYLFRIFQGSSGRTKLHPAVINPWFLSDISQKTILEVFPSNDLQQYFITERKIFLNIKNTPYIFLFLDRASQMRCRRKEPLKI